MGDHKDIPAIIHENVSDFNSMLIGGTEDITSVERENLIYNLWKLGQETGSIREDHGSLTDLSDQKQLMQ